MFCCPHEACFQSSWRTISQLVVDGKGMFLLIAFSLLHGSSDGNASVNNSSCTQSPPPAPPSLPSQLIPRHKHFFCLGWQILGGGDPSYYINMLPSYGTESRSKIQLKEISSCRFLAYLLYLPCNLKF